MPLEGETNHRHRYSAVTSGEVVASKPWWSSTAFQATIILATVTAGWGE
ncbi:MAG: hypothetical protein RLZZ568_1382 [Cyanobacteriota bacterium]|jgi:hypothetical protein